MQITIITQMPTAFWRVPFFIRSDDDEAMDIWARIYIDKMDPTQLNVSEG
ncbi:unnamed protein product [Fusarium graminearum]|nr:unnamed protein product [Fusarium graminearum]